MSLSWANKLAKSALLSAQKHIDSVLDIQDDDDDSPECGAAAENELENAVTEEDRSDEGTTSPPRKEFLGNVSKFVDTELSVSTSHPENWTMDYDPNKSTPVVDSEPNPIRDAHDESITPLNYSPSSNFHTPEEDEIGEAESAMHQPSFDLSIVNNVEHNEAEAIELCLSVKSNQSNKVEVEEAITVASSDIEVVKPVDDWSVCSGNQWRGSVALSDQTSSQAGVKINSLVKDALNHSDILNAINPHKTQQEFLDQIALLNAKLQHKEQQIEEFIKQNEKLRTANTNLLSKNKQISIKATLEAKLQKQLVDKEKELNELMEEGKRLSEHCGKQSKEIRRLKQQTNQLDIVTAARDDAMKELQISHQKVAQMAKEVEELKDSLNKAEKRIEELKTESNLTRESSNIVENDIAEKNSEITKLQKEIERLNVELKSTMKEKNDFHKEVKALNLKLLNKRAYDCVESDREKGQYEDLVTERARNTALLGQVRALEQKIESLKNAQRDVALQITEANAPLLSNITNLEMKLRNAERQNESLTNQLCDATETVNQLKLDMDSNVRTLTQRVEEQREMNDMKNTELKRYSNENNKFQMHIEDLEKKLNTTENELKSARRYSDEITKELNNELVLKQKEYNNLELKYSELFKKISVQQEQHVLSHSQPLDVCKEERESDDLRTSSEQITTTDSLPKLTTMNTTHNDEADEAQDVLDLKFVDDTNAVMPSLIEIKMDDNSNTPFRPILRDNFSSSGSDVYQQRLTKSHSVSNSVGVEFLSAELEESQGQLYQLREKFDHLLELYGGCLETIDELKYDNEDLRKLCKEQALEISSSRN